MTAHRLLAGVPCIAHSPSLYEILTPLARGGVLVTSTYVIFTGVAWTLEWTFQGETQRCALGFASPEAVMEYILGLSVAEQKDRTNG